MSNVRQSWLESTVRCLQANALTGHESALECVASRVEIVADGVPRPCGVAERLILSSLLLEFSAQLGRHAHRSVHRSRFRCAFQESEILMRVWSDRSEPPTAILRKWLAQFISGILATHRVEV